jgi:hypothetical protein
MGSVLAMGVALAACAPANKSIVEVGEPQPFTPPGGDAANPAEVAAQAIDFEPLDIKGITFSPGALDDAELPGNGVTVKRSIADQRKRAGKAKGAAKLTEGKDLALVLWYTAPSGEPKEIRRQLKAQRAEALTVLTPLAADPAATEDILAAYAAAEQSVGDEGKAATAWDAVITRFPKSGKLARYHALRDYLALKGRQPLPFPLPEKLDGAPYEASYVSAWVKYRGGDKAGAVADITRAAKAWTNLETLVSLRRDIMLIYSRAGGDPAAAYALIEEVSKKDKGDMQKIGDALADAYGYAGEYEAASALRDKLAGGAAGGRLAEIRLAQSLVSYRLLRPGDAADGALAAWKEVQGAGDAAPVELREAVAKQIVSFGMIFHSEYAKTHDLRFADPAKKLYAAYLGIPGRADSGKVKDELVPNLDTTIKTYSAAGATPPPGALDQQTVQRHVGSYLEQVGACYESQLQADPALAFTGKLVFSVGADGKVSDAKVDGAAEGDKGAPGVAKCLAARAGAWLFPASGTAAKVSYPFNFKPAKPS